MNVARGRACTCGHVNTIARAAKAGHFGPDTTAYPPYLTSRARPSLRLLREGAAGMADGNRLIEQLLRRAGFGVSSFPAASATTPKATCTPRRACSPAGTQALGRSERSVDVVRAGWVGRYVGTLAPPLDPLGAWNTMGDAPHGRAAGDRVDSELQRLRL